MTPPESRGYPRPQLVRAEWESLNGRWDFAFDRSARAVHPSEVPFDRSIVVPFAPETERSGINDPSFTDAVWYRTVWKPPLIAPGERLLLHFGAVDYHATVWVDGRYAGEHEGGYTPFTIDLTPHVRGERPLEIAVRAHDDPQDLAKPRGKQDWQLIPHAIWYPRTTGIWQTVWVERVPETFIAALRWSSNIERWEVQLQAQLAGPLVPGLTLALRLQFQDQVLVDDVYSVTHREVHRRIPLSDPGIDDSRNVLLWSPARPTLLAAHLELRDPAGVPFDIVESYTALRTIAVQDDQILLNGRPVRLQLVLDQGYWPESGQTPPSDEAIRADVDLVRKMGFNGVRKHQKIEDPRFLYWADQLGLLVWEEMPSAYRFTAQSVERLTREWLEVLARDASHPCVIAWVPFNESWGVPNLPANPAERNCVKALYHLTRTLDPSRPVIGNDGWESIATDIVGVHDYDPDPRRLAERYHGPTVRTTLYRRQRYGGRLMVLDEHEREHPIVLTEFGGMSLANPDVSQWGYAVASDPDEFEAKFAELIGTVRSLSLFAGYCYTQLADTYQEINGLLYADRTPKIPIEVVRALNEGPK